MHGDNKSKSKKKKRLQLSEGMLTMQGLSPKLLQNWMSIALWHQEMNTKSLNSYIITVRHL